MNSSDLKKRLPRCNWTTEELALLIEMRADNKTHAQIANKLGKNKRTIHNFLSKNAKKLGLDMQQREDALSDKEWLGCVPYLHWTITKDWRIRT